jgi:hypothetical protein
MMKTRKIQEKLGAPRHSSVSSRARVSLGLSITALVGAMTLSCAVPALSGALPGPAGQYSHPVRTVITGNGAGNTGPTAGPKPTPVPPPPTVGAGETGCCA